MKLTPHQKIMRAYHRGTGLRLSKEDIVNLTLDDAVVTAATDQSYHMGVCVTCCKALNASGRCDDHGEQ
jgi:hypothetical protein